MFTRSLVSSSRAASMLTTPKAQPAWEGDCSHDVYPGVDLGGRRFLRPDDSLIKCIARRKLSRQIWNHDSERRGFVAGSIAIG